MKSQKEIEDFILENSPLPGIEEISFEQCGFVYDIFVSFHERPEIFDKRIWDIFSDYDGFGVFQHIVFAHETLGDDTRKASILRGLTINNKYSNSLACMVLATFPYPEFRSIVLRLATSEEEEVRWVAKLAIDSIDDL